MENYFMEQIEDFETLFSLTIQGIETCLPRVDGKSHPAAKALTMLDVQLCNIISNAKIIAAEENEIIERKTENSRKSSSGLLAK